MPPRRNPAAPVSARRRGHPPAHRDRPVRRRASRPASPGPRTTTTQHPPPQALRRHRLHVRQAHPRAAAVPRREPTEWHRALARAPGRATRPRVRRRLPPRRRGDRRAGTDGSRREATDASDLPRTRNEKQDRAHPMQAEQAHRARRVSPPPRRDRDTTDGLRQPGYPRRTLRSQHDPGPTHTARRTPASRRAESDGRVRATSRGRKAASTDTRGYEARVNRQGGSGAARRWWEATHPCLQAGSPSLGLDAQRPSRELLARPSRGQRARPALRPRMHRGSAPDRRHAARSVAAALAARTPSTAGRSQGRGSGHRVGSGTTARGSTTWGFRGRRRR